MFLVVVLFWACSCEPEISAPDAGPVEDLDTGEDSGGDSGTLDAGDGGVTAEDAGDEEQDSSPEPGDVEDVGEGGDAEADVGPGDLCENPARQPPPGWTRLATGDLSCEFTQQGWNSSADCTEFEGIWPAPFMEMGQLSRHLGIRSDHGRDYLAIRFSTEGMDDDHTGAFSLNVSTWLRSRRKIITVSPCPGDFDQESNLAETGCYMESLVQHVRLGGIDSNRPCKLESGREYYLNILYTDSPLGTPAEELGPHPDCVDATQACGNLFSPG
jgi:hypothetical protein